MRDILLASIVFGLLPYVLKRPYWGILLAAWLGYMNPHLLCYGFMPTMPVVLIVVLTTMVGMMFSKEPKRMVWSREIIALLIFIAWMGITTTQALYYDLAMEQYTKVIKIQILTLMALLLLTSREKVNLFIWIIVLSLGFYGVKGGIFTILHGGSFRVNGPGGFIGGNNEIALALVMTIPLMRYLHLQETRPHFKLGLSAAMLLTAIAAVGSQSRGALVGITLMGTLFWLKSRNKFMSALLIVFAVGAIGSVMPQEWYDRMNTIKSYEQDQSARGRINAWWAALNLAKSRITGGGFETFRPAVFRQYAPDPNDVHDVHSIYFEVLGEHGFIGLIFFLSLLALTWMKCSTIIRLGKKNPELRWAQDLAAMLQVSMVAYMSSGAFLGLAYFDYIYHLIAVTVVVHHLITTVEPASATHSPSRQKQPEHIGRRFSNSPRTGQA